MSRSNVKTLLSIASVLALAPFAVSSGSSPLPAVVEIRVWTGAGMAERATGTVIADGRVLTVAHALEGARRIEVVLGRGEGAGRGGVGGEASASRGEGAVGGAPGVVAATIVRRDAALDLAVLRVPGATGPRARFGEAEEDLQVVTPRGAEAAALRRRVNARLVDQAGRPRRPSLELAADVVSGDSGAPVVDAAGEIVGVVYARSTQHGGTAYATRVARLPVVTRP